MKKLLEIRPSKKIRFGSPVHVGDCVVGTVRFYDSWYYGIFDGDDEITGPYASREAAQMAAARMLSNLQD